MTTESEKSRPVGSEFMVRGDAVKVMYLLGRHGTLTESRMRAWVGYTGLLRTLGDLEDAGYVMRVGKPAEPVPGATEGRSRAKTGRTVTEWMLTPIGRKIAEILLQAGNLFARSDIAVITNEFSYGTPARDDKKE